MRAFGTAGFLRCHVCGIPRQLRTVFQKPVHALGETRKALDEVVVDNFHREEWDEPDHRAHFERNEFAMQMQLIVVEAVLFVPESGASQRIHGV